MKMAEGGDDYDALLSKMDKLQTAIDAIEGWELDRQLERAMQALRCPPGANPCTTYILPRLLQSVKFLRTAIHWSLFIFLVTMQCLHPCFFYVSLLAVDHVVKTGAVTTLPSGYFQHCKR